MFNPYKLRLSNSEFYSSTELNNELVYQQCGLWTVWDHPSLGGVFQTEH